MSPQKPLAILMAVPMFPPPFIGGLEKQSHELALALVERGHRVSVLSGKQNDAQSEFAQQHGIDVHRIVWPRRRWLRFLIEPWLILRQFRRIVARVDAVHCHVFSGFGLYLVLLARLHRKPVLVKLPNVGIDGLPGLRQRRFGALLLRIFRMADAVVAMSVVSKRELDAIGFDRRRVLATPNGIRIRPLATPRPLSGTNCRFVFVGRLHGQKGLPDLLLACQQLERRGLSGRYALDLIGSGPLEASLGQAILRLELGGVVRMLGASENVRDLMAGYDALVLPSYREGNSNAILEAMAEALPVISTAVGGTPMLVGAAGAPLLHAPGDIEALALLMQRLIEEPDARGDIGAQMRERVARYFDIEQVAQTYVRAYEFLRAGQRERVASVSNPVIDEDT